MDRGDEQPGPGSAQARGGSPAERAARRAAAFRVARRTIMALWAPSLLPFLFGPLTGCDHCVRAYLECVPLLPGFLLPVLLQLEGPWFVGVAVLATLLVLGGVSVLLQAAGGHWRIVALGVGLLSAANALSLAAALRA